MLLKRKQLDYSPLYYEALKRDFNVLMFNFANQQSDIISTIPKDIAQISRLTESLANISIISGNCFFFKQGKDFKVVEENNVYFDNKLNIIKLKPILSHTLEPKQNKTKIATEQKIRIFDKDRVELKSIDDLLIKKSTINITTNENRYKYIITIELEELQSFNNILLKLNEETLSYPEISEIYYVDNRRNKKNIKIFNNNSYSYNIDLNKNSSNTYSIDFDIIEADNISIVLEDVGLDLLIDALDLNLTEYSEEGSIIFEALSEPYHILKVGLEGKLSDDRMDFKVSNNKEDWYDIDLSNTFDIQKINKVISFNTISENSVKTSEDVKKLYLKIIVKAVEKTITHNPKIVRELHSTASFSTIKDDVENYSLYESDSNTHYGNTSVSNIFNFNELYDRGEYLVIDNKYYVKGFLETPVSKILTSSYIYSPVTLKTKEIRISNRAIELPQIDISTKNIFSYELETITKNIVDLSHLRCVIPLKTDVVQGIYYLRQDESEIPIDLSLGFINSSLDMFYVCNKDVDKEVFLLDSFKRKIKKLDRKSLTLDGEEIQYVSLLDIGFFQIEDNLSRTYPLTPLSDNEIGFLDNKIEAINKDRELNISVLSTKLMYTKDSISSKNYNYLEIISEEDYNRSKEKEIELISSTLKQYKFKKGTVVKGSIKSNNNKIEVPFINGYTEFLEIFSKTIEVKRSGVTSNLKIEFTEPDVIPESLSYFTENSEGENLKLKVVKEDDVSFLVIEIDKHIADLHIKVSYSYRSTEPKNMYSVDYNKGVIFFSEPLETETEVSYESDRIFITGRKGRQLDQTEFSYVEGKVNINNFKENTTISFLYSKKKEVKRNISPVLQDLKMNYITTDSRSL